MHSGGRKLHQLMVIADCPLRSLANGGLYVRDVGDCRRSAMGACGTGSFAKGGEGMLPTKVMEKRAP